MLSGEAYTLIHYAMNKNTHNKYCSKRRIIPTAYPNLLKEYSIQAVFLFTFPI